MNTLFRPLGVALFLSVGASVYAAGPAEAAKAADAAKAAESCETAVTDTIKEMRGRDAQDVQFNKDKRVLTPASGEETDVKGAGRYLGVGGSAMSFTYGCAFNATTGATSGVVIRDAGPARGSEEKAWEPDLASVSPEACETAVAADLKGKHPRIGRIVFGSDSRRLRPAPNGRASLEGIGALERAPGMNSSQFTYRCEFEQRSGKIVRLQTSD